MERIWTPDGNGSEGSQKNDSGQPKVKTDFFKEKNLFVSLRSAATSAGLRVGERGMYIRCLNVRSQKKKTD